MAPEQQQKLEQVRARLGEEYQGIYQKVLNRHDFDFPAALRMAVRGPGNKKTPDVVNVGRAA
jgi:hypothetical protein